MKTRQRFWFADYLICIAEVIAANAAAFLIGIFNKSTKGLYLITERGTDARDNGYCFYRFLKEQYTEVNVKYVIKRGSPDEKKIEARDRVNFMSFRHMIYYILAAYKISTHHDINTPYHMHYHFADRLGGGKGKRVMLQHGVIKDDMKYFHYPWLKTDLFVCGGHPEYLFVKNTYGHPEGVVRELGLSRWDRLHDIGNPVREILLMPTWRAYATYGDRQEFLESNVYKEYQGLLNDKRLEEILADAHIKLIFYPHYEMQRFNAFSSSLPHVEIKDMKTADVQALLIEAKYLITDYSSVFFDFAYMGKQMIYYQFDEDEYRKGHYKEGYFSYENDGFGPVVKDRNSLFSEIEKMIKSDSNIYQTRTEDFFTYRDANNSKRIFEAISTLKGQN